MNKMQPFRTEAIRLILIGFCSLPLYPVLGSISYSIIFALSIYILFILFKLHQVLSWLKDDMNKESTPDSSGVICTIISYMQRLNRQYDNDDNNDNKQLDKAKQFNEIISALPSATVIINKSNQIEWANYSALLLLGIDAKKDMGINIDSLVRHSIFVKKLHEPNCKEFEINSPVDEDITLVVQIAEYGDDKRLLLAHNISANMESQRTRRIFVANASHELKTPLTVISGYLEFIESTPELPESLQMPVERALEQSTKMRILIEDLLLLSKLENKELTQEDLSNINVKQHMATIVATLCDSGKLERSQIIEDIDISLNICASVKELDSVCYNLINNAIKYAESGDSIHISWKRQSNGYAKFSVTDQGIGIAPEHIAHLTERFYRVDSGRSRRVGGTGLGLSITKHIVERHKGQMEIYSNLGVGSTFSVSLPIKQPKNLTAICSC